MTNNTKPTTDQLVLAAMLKAGWLTAPGCTVVDKDSNTVKA
jgi:hypothetical protein